MFFSPRARLSQSSLAAVLSSGSWLGLASGWAQTTPPQPTQPTSPPLVIQSVPHVYDYYNFAAIDPIAERVRAHGQFLESFGEYLKKVKEADLFFEEVKKRRIENRLALISSYYEIQRMRWEEQEKAKDRIVESKKKEAARKEDVLSHLAMNAVTASGGGPLNQILEFIQLLNTSENRLKAKPIELPPDLLEHLRLTEGVGKLRATLDFGGKPQPDFLFVTPSLFKSNEPFKPVLDEYTRVRQELRQALQRKQEVNDDQSKQARDLLRDLGDKLAKWQSERQWTRYPNPEYDQYKECQRFLEEQFTQVGLLTVGTSKLPPFEGKTVQDLVDYMSAHGFRFSRVDGASANAYLALFNKLRDLLSQLE